MNRRQFHRMALATTASSVTLPLGGAAISAPAALPRGAYAFAVAMAKARGHVSETLLSQALKVSPAEAAHLMERLQAREVIFAPDAGGVSITKNPMFRQGVAPPTAPHPVSGTPVEAPDAWQIVAHQIHKTSLAYHG